MYNHIIGAQKRFSVIISIFIITANNQTPGARQYAQQYFSIGYKKIMSK